MVNILHDKDADMAALEGKTIAVVNEPNCKGCGMCLPVCPENAIELIGYTDVEIESMIDAMAE